MTEGSEAATTAPATHDLPIEFHATGGEYFRIWIVNLLLSIITLGIYSAWAKVRRLRYFYGSTMLDGASFEYHGRPIAILKGRIIVVGSYLVYVITARLWPSIWLQILVLPGVILGVPWVIVRARRFQMRMTSWRGLRFNFHGRYGGAMGAFVGWTVLAGLTLFILYPMALWKQVNFLTTNTAYGSQRFKFHTTLGRFYEFCLIALGIAFGAGFILAFFIGIVGAAALFSGGLPAPGSPPAPPDPAAVLGVMAIIMPFYLAFFLLVNAYYRANFLNASIGGVSVGPHRISSRLKFGPLLGIFFTNLLGIVFTLGLFYPWAKVRMLRYQLANTSVIAAGDLGQFVADQEAGPGAVGEEAADFFDIDFGL
jgi:uncharacterized membrane protein YjgN (DUF898 family)